MILAAVTIRERGQAGKKQVCQNRGSGAEGHHAPTRPESPPGTIFRAAPEGPKRASCFTSDVLRVPENGDTDQRVAHAPNITGLTVL